jgi:cobalt-zinc-cadmium efflux system protein
MSHDHHPAHNNQQRLLLVLSITSLFMLFEAIGGWIAGSLALVADAGHMLTDSMALLFAYIAAKFASKDPTSSHTFGWLRLPILAALINSLALLAITLLIFWEALQRLFEPQPINSNSMLAIAFAGLIANLICFKLLHSGPQQNLNIRGAMLHVLADLLGSVGAIIAAIGIRFTGWVWIDPILSVLVSLLIVRGAYRLLKESSHELLEAVPQDLDTQQLSQALTSDFSEITQVHHLHVWQVAGKRCLTLHAQIAIIDDQDKLLHRLQQWLKEQHAIDHATLQFEHLPCNQPHCQLTADSADKVHACHHH